MENQIFLKRSRAGFIKLQHTLGMISRVNALLLIIVVVPTIASTIYYGLIASDIYVSEAKFLVRSPDRQSASPLGFFLNQAGFSRSQDDAYTIQDFILSRDALISADRDLHIKTAFSASSVDIVSRFDPFGRNDSYEKFYRYYQKMVDVQVESASSILTLKTSAFTAKDAHALNERLLEMSEALVNKLNERARLDMIRFASEEVAKAEARSKAAAVALAHYRDKQGVIDPEKQSGIPLQQVAKLQDELVATKAQIALLEKLAKDSPQLPAFRQRAQLLTEAINTESARIAGASDRSLASKASEYRRLELDKEFSDKMLASAMSTLEQARNEAQRKQLYLERISRPSFPDASLEPHRFTNVIITLVISLIIWGILTLLIHGINEHHE
ncbi:MULTISPECIES: hypothetical protein [Burkholderia]|nr:MULTISPECIES: hypothetical protein [Burkholderia]